MKLGWCAILMTLLAGCVTPHVDAPPKTGPFEVVFSKPQWPEWSKGRRGYDSQLPGYHFDGEYGLLTFRPIIKNPPRQLVIAITAHCLEDFRIYNKDMKIDWTGISVFKPGNRITWELIETEKVIETASCLTSSYLQIKWEKKDENHVLYYVTLQPKTMELLRKECRIEWGVWR